MSTPTVNQRLEAWLFTHKSRSVWIEHDNGYGASAWVVELTGFVGGKEAKAQAVSHACDKNDPPVTSDPPWLVRVTSGDGEWGTLDDVIMGALDRWEKLYPATARAAS